jgi:hypothetical protein
VLTVFLSLVLNKQTQISILSGNGKILGSGVVTGVRKGALNRKSEYRISTLGAADCWVRLQKLGKQTGASYVPLRRVIKDAQ